MCVSKDSYITLNIMGASADFMLKDAGILLKGNPESTKIVGR